MLSMSKRFDWLVDMICVVHVFAPRDIIYKVMEHRNISLFSITLKNCKLLDPNVDSKCII